MLTSLRCLLMLLMLVMSLVHIQNGGAAEGTEAAASAYGSDPVVCDFVLPGNFKAAVAKAKKENKAILIKGVAFGMDALGAKCATQGHW